jgi:hypothetical protein
MVSEYKLSLAEKLGLCVLMPVLYALLIPYCMVGLVVDCVYPATPLPRERVVDAVKRLGNGWHTSQYLIGKHGYWVNAQEERRAYYDRLKATRAMLGIAKGRGRG